MCEFQFYLNTHITVKQCGFMDSEKEVEKWSESNFGARGGSTMLLGKVKEIINSSDFVIHFPYDSTVPARKSEKSHVARAKNKAHSSWI